MSFRSSATTVAQIPAHEGLPTWFRASCAEVAARSIRGHRTYRNVGYAFIRALGSEQPYDCSDEQFAHWCEELAEACRLEQHGIAWEMFANTFPRFAALIPTRRRAGFIDGFSDALEAGEGPF